MVFNEFCYYLSSLKRSSVFEMTLSRVQLNYKFDQLWLITTHQFALSLVQQSLCQYLSSWPLNSIYITCLLLKLCLIYSAVKKQIYFDDFSKLIFQKLREPLPTPFLQDIFFNDFCHNFMLWCDEKHFFSDHFFFRELISHLDSVCARFCLFCLPI